MFNKKKRISKNSYLSIMRTVLNNFLNSLIGRDASFNAISPKNGKALQDSFMGTNQLKKKTNLALYSVKKRINKPKRFHLC